MIDKVTDRDDDVRALRAMLPAPDVAPMSDAARARVEERVWSRLDKARSAARPTAGQSKNPRSSRRLRVGVVATVAAALVVVPAVLLPVADRHDDGAASSGGAEAALSIGAAPAAAEVLDDAAAAAIARQASFVAPRADQWVYVRSRLDTIDPKPWMDPDADREMWRSQLAVAPDGSDVFRKAGQTYPLVGTGKASPASLDRPTVQWLLALPTEPAMLERALRRDLVTTGQSDDDQAVFNAIGSLISENLVPPRLEAAFYQVGKRIRGVTTASDVRDAEGRSGIGVTRTDARTGNVDTWIFDRHDLTYLGGRTSSLMSYNSNRPVRVESVYAVLQRAIVDHRLERPTR